MKDTDRELLEVELRRMERLTKLRFQHLEKRLKMLEDVGLTPNEVRAFRSLAGENLTLEQDWRLSCAEVWPGKITWVKHGPKRKKKGT